MVIGIGFKGLIDSLPNTSEDVSVGSDAVVPMSSMLDKVISSAVFAVVFDLFSTFFIFL